MTSKIMSVNCLKGRLKAKRQENWSSYFRSPSRLVEYLRHVIVHVEFLLTILTKSKTRATLEVGCGSGLHSCFISHFTRRCVALYKEPSIIKTAKENCKHLKGSKVDFLVADAFFLPFKNKCFRISFNQGVLEHFDDKEIQLLLKEMLRVSNLVIFSVPSINYPSLTFGDERLMSLEDWAKILKKTTKNFHVGYYKIDLSSIKKNIIKFKWPMPLHIIGIVKSYQRNSKKHKKVIKGWAF